MTYQAILFDMDGVIIDTHHSVTDFWLALAAEEGVTLSQTDFEQHIYGCPAEHTFQTLFPHFDRAKKAAIFKRIEQHELNLSYTPVTGIIPLLHQLRREAIPTALVTSGDRWKVEVVVNQLGLTQLFTTQVTINDVQQGKPAPDPYLLAAQRLGQPPQRCLVFEDTVSGVKAAIAAGATCIGVQASATLGFALHEAGAIYTIADFTMVNLQLLVNPDDRREIVRYLQFDSGPTLLLA